MRCSIVLLCSAILVLLDASVSRHLSVDIVKNQVKFMAQTTVVRIRKLTDEFQISPNVVFNHLDLIPDITPDKPVEGLASIMDSLDTFQMILIKIQMDGVSQVQADLLSLQDVIQSLALQSNCSLPKLRDSNNLDTFLKTNSNFPVTIINVALDRLQRLLNKLIAYMDQLNTC